MHRATPTEDTRWRAEQLPRLLRVEVRLGKVERYLLLGTLLFGHFDDLVGVGELHARVAEYHHEAAFWQGFLNEVEQNTTVLAARKCHVEVVEPILVLGVDSQYFFYSALLDNFKHLTVCFNHSSHVNG